jgi:hypothetical protein
MEKDELVKQRKSLLLRWKQSKDANIPPQTITLLKALEENMNNLIPFVMEERGIDIESARAFIKKKDENTTKKDMTKYGW